MASSADAGVSLESWELPQGVSLHALAQCFQEPAQLTQQPAARPGQDALLSGA
jgi:hypothetical protein